MEIDQFVGVLPRVAQAMARKHQSMIRAHAMQRITWNRSDYDTLERAVRDVCRERRVDFDLPMMLSGAEIVRHAE